MDCAGTDGGLFRTMPSQAFHRSRIAHVAEAFGIHRARFAGAFNTCLVAVGIRIGAFRAGASGRANTRLAKHSTTEASAIARFGVGLHARLGHSEIRIFLILGNEVADSFRTGQVAGCAGSIAGVSAAPAIDAEARLAIVCVGAASLEALPAIVAPAIDIDLVAILDRVVALGADVFMAIAISALHIVHAFEAPSFAVANSRV